MTIEINCPHSNEWFEMTDAEMSPFIMRHDCKKLEQCWNDIHRPRLELLKKCFGGIETKIKPMDVDGTVERNGYFLFLEFKGSKDAFGDEQRGKTALDIYHEALTSQVRLVNKNLRTLSSPTTTSVYVVGNAKTMEVEAIKVIYGGEFQGWEACDLYELRRLCWEWHEWTEVLRKDDDARAVQEVRAKMPPHPMIKKSA